MKKGLTILLVFALCACALTACGARRPVGTWTATINGAEGQMTLNKDGSGEMVSDGVTRACTWEVADGKLTVVQDLGDQEYVFLDRVSYTVKGGTLTVTSMAGNTLVFEKE